MTRSEKKNDMTGCLYLLLFLVAAGLVILYSKRLQWAGEISRSVSLFEKQGFATLLGLFVYWLIARVDYHKWTLAIPAYVTSIILSVLLYFRDEYNATSYKRWLSLG